MTTVSSAKVTTDKKEMELWDQWRHYERYLERLNHPRTILSRVKEIQQPSKPKPEKIPFRLTSLAVYKRVGSEWDMLFNYMPWCGTGLDAIKLMPEHSIEVSMPIKQYKGKFKVVVPCGKEFGRDYRAELIIENETGDEILTEGEKKARDDAIIKSCIADAHEIIKEARAEEDLTTRYASLVHLAKRIKELPTTREEELNQAIAEVKETVNIESSFAANMLRNGITTMPVK